MAMAAVQAIGGSRAAAFSVASSSSSSSSTSGCCRGLEAGVCVALPQVQRRQRGLYGSAAASSGCRAAAMVARRFSRLDANAGSGVDESNSEPAAAEEEEEEEAEAADGMEMAGELSLGFYEKAFLTGAIALMPLVDVGDASAAGGEFGLLEGRSVALVHPLVMGGLFVYTVYAGYLGWQWRRVRTIQNDITELKKQGQKVPVAAGDKSAPPPPPSPVEAQINSLTEERKELVKGGFRDRHFNAGSILLGLGVFESVGGAVNTWFRTGKLFPGPHLFAGATITICWALAAALVPAMQKGNDSARNLHIGLNLINVALFVWQIPTGWEIVLKVFEFTTWP